MHGGQYIETRTMTNVGITTELIDPRLATCYPNCGTRPSGNSGNWAAYKANYNPREMSFKSGSK